jgi:hypothetical protein
MVLRPDERLLEANLRALGARSALAAEAVRRAREPEGIEWEVAPDGGLTGVDRRGGGARQVASRRAPIEEGRRLAGQVDVVQHAATAVLGFGAGHHVAALAGRYGVHGAVVVFEPDAGMLRAVLSRVDYAGVFRSSNVVVLTSESDAGAMAAGLQGLEAVVSSGLRLLEHPASAGRLGAARERFGATLTQVMQAVRTNVVTTLVQVDVTVRNLLQNLRWYARVAGVGELAGAAKGRAAVVVSAGPSLRRNIELLARPGVRESVVIIAVQTVLKPLLAKGIRPHFVTALDYHEMSRRFYEGLTAADVEGVTLVAEPKANPAILEAFPGTIRCVGDDVLDQVLGADLARDMGRLTPGATVAHLAYYLARHLGCDPVILMGQDLGFSEGQYYAPGAAIHRVWGGEVSEFRTLEMFEWERIARMRSMLRRCEDVHGRTIYTDEQMSTYLVQFEREFARDAERGLRVIDATEGGVRKRHTTAMTLAEALGAFGVAGGVPAGLGAGSGVAGEARRLERVAERLRELRRESGRVGALAREAGEILREMLAHQREQGRVNRLIGRVQEVASKAAANPAHWLVQHVNQAGQLNRYRADRAIAAEGVTGLERQRREIERDLKNVEWLADASGVVEEMLDDALGALSGGALRTRDATPTVRRAVAASGGGGRRRVWACVRVDAGRGGLGAARDLGEAFVGGMNPLQLLLARLARCARLAGVLLTGEDAGTCARLAGVDVTGGAGRVGGLRVEWCAADPADAARGAWVAPARAWSRHAWRGGIGNLTAWDECLMPRTCAREMARLEIDAAVVLGADWALADPSLIDAVIERHEERPDAHGVTFCPGAPGLAGALVARGVMEELARVGGSEGTLGTLLGYHPIAPQADPIARGVCVEASPVVRDALVRFIPDTPRHAARLAGALAGLGSRVVEADAGALVAAAHAAGLHTDGPAEALTVPVRRGMERTAVLEALRRALAEGDAPAVTFTGDGVDALEAPGLTELVAAARALGASATCVRTRLTGEGDATRRVLTLADVVRVDVGAERPETYAAVMGAPGETLAHVRAAAEALAARARGRRAGEGEDGPWWMVAAMEKRDEVLDEMEDFYNRWLLTGGACVLGPRTDGARDARIEPLPLPEGVARRLAWSRGVVGGWRTDGTSADAAVIAALVTA